MAERSIGAHIGLRYVFFITAAFLLACAWLNWHFVRITFREGEAI